MPSLETVGFRNSDAAPVSSTWILFQSCIFFLFTCLVFVLRGILFWATWNYVAPELTYSKIKRVNIWQALAVVSFLAIL